MVSRIQNIASMKDFEPLTGEEILTLLIIL